MSSGSFGPTIPIKSSATADDYGGKVLNTPVVVNAGNVGSLGLTGTEIADLLVKMNASGGITSSNMLGTSTTVGVNGASSSSSLMPILVGAAALGVFAWWILRRRK